MATLKIKNLNKVSTAIRKKIIKASRSSEIRTGIGEVIVDQIQKEPVPVTSEATIAWRKYLEKANLTSKKYKRRMINITFTGELLNDLKKNVRAKFSPTKIEYIIEQTTKKHKKYKKANGKPSKGSAKTHKEIGDLVTSKGYDYLTFSSTSKKRVLEFIKTNIFKKLK